MSFDEEHLDDHHLCQREVAERDARIAELESSLATLRSVAHEHYQPQIDELIAENNQAREEAGRYKAALHELRVDIENTGHIGLLVRMRFHRIIDTALTPTATEGRDKGEGT